MNRDSFVFYSSFYEAISDLEESDKIKAYDAVCKYALKGELPQVTGVVSAVFKLIKPQIDANNKRYLNGHKGAEFGKLGGRPKKETPKEEKQNPKITPLKPLNNPTETPNVNVNVNDNVNVKDKKDTRHRRGEYALVLLSDTEIEKLNHDYGEEATKAAITFLDEYKKRKGYKCKDDYLTLKKWVYNAVDEEKVKQQKKAPQIDERNYNYDDLTARFAKN